MKIVVTGDPGGATAISETVALSPTAAGCTSSLASTVCVLSIALAPGSYDAAISTYDAANNALSAGQTIDFTITSAQTNNLAFVLNGIPAAIRVTSAAPAIHGAQDSGFTEYGTGAQPFAAEAIDADGNIIVGVGAPTFTIAQAVGSGFTITAPTTSAPNTFALTPPGTNNQGATFTATAAYPDGTCATTVAVCTASFTVTNDLQTLFVVAAGTSKINAYAYPYTGTPTAITSGVSAPVSLALDAENHLFVCNINNGTVTEYAPPYSGAPIATTAKGAIGEAGAIAVDRSGNLFVADESNHAVEVFAPPYTGTPIVMTSGLGIVVSIAVDGTGNVFAGSIYPDINVVEFSPPFSSASTPSATITTSSPQLLATDRGGNLFVDNESNVQVLAPPFTGTGTTVSTDMHAPETMFVDGSGKLYADNVNGANSNITIYTPPYSGTPQIVAGVVSPEGVAVDGTGTMAVVVGGGSKPGLYLFAPPYTSAPTINTNSSSTSATEMLLTP